MFIRWLNLIQKWNFKFDKYQNFNANHLKSLRFPTSSSSISYLQCKRIKNVKLIFKIHFDVRDQKQIVFSKPGVLRDSNLQPYYFLIVSFHSNLTKLNDLRAIYSILRSFILLQKNIRYVFENRKTAFDVNTVQGSAWDKIINGKLSIIKIIFHGALSFQNEIKVAFNVSPLKIAKIKLIFVF